MKKLYIMCGVPGAGKGYWIKQNIPLAAVCSADHYFYELGNGTYAFDASKLGRAHGFCKETARIFMEAGMKSIVIDNTNLDVRSMKPYLDLAEMFKYDVEIIRITPSSFSEAFKRCVHNVPEDAHSRMVEKFCQKLLPEGINVQEIES